MSIPGIYVLSSNEKYAEWLAAVGIPADAIARLEKAKPQLTVTHTGDQVVVKTVAGDKNFTNTITLGQESKAGLPGGLEYTMTLTLSGSKLTGTYSMAGKTGNASVEFTAAGAVQTMSQGGTTAKRVYTRQ
ncbi:Fatty acid-binding protein, liver [Chionoecetes opilio]|uniref:Fatty acid-binding protein, liver n=1 Tax=Chionoecetes opilio TaxID=41210 RepID=A0A8J4XSS7_CHIOP|nr:Fatty acid-binding protein, liver [Chionoecetes opilio]